MAGRARTAENLSKRMRTVKKGWLPARLGSVAVLALGAGCRKERSASMRPVAVVSAADLELGRKHFAVYCAACHQVDRSGTWGGPPPLMDSPWIRGPETRVIRIVLNGLRGPIEIKGKVYNLEMPGFGTMIDDVKMATLLTYARAQFGGLNEPLRPEVVNRIRAATKDRAGYWTAPELLVIP